MKTQVEEINRNIYDVKNKDEYDFKIKKGLTREIIEEISKQKNARYKMYRAFLSYLFCVINLQKLLLLDTEQHKRHNLHKRQHRSHNDLLPER